MELRPPKPPKEVMYVTVRVVRLQWSIWLNRMLLQIVHLQFFSICQ